MSSPYASPQTSPRYHPKLQTIWEDKPAHLEAIPVTSLQLELLDMEEAQAIQESMEPRFLLKLPPGRAIPPSLLTDLLEDAMDEDESSDEEDEVFTYPSDEEEDDEIPAKTKKEANNERSCSYQHILAHSAPQLAMVQ